MDAAERALRIVEYCASIGFAYDEEVREVVQAAIEAAEADARAHLRQRVALLEAGWSVARAIIRHVASGACLDPVVYCRAALQNPPVQEEPDAPEAE